LFVARSVLWSVVADTLVVNVSNAEERNNRPTENRVLFLRVRFGVGSEWLFERGSEEICGR
jgi:hypothetical protein